MSYRDAAVSDTEGQIVDLSRLIEKLATYEDISDDLTEEEERKLVDYVRSCAEMSHAKISRRYDHWTEADRAHDVYVRPDATAFRERPQPCPARRSWSSDRRD